MRIKLLRSITQPRSLAGKSGDVLTVRPGDASRLIDTGYATADIDEPQPPRVKAPRPEPREDHGEAGAD